MATEVNGVSNESFAVGDADRAAPATPKLPETKKGSRKFHIQTVDVSEDPLYSKDGGSRPGTPQTPRAATLPAAARPRSPSPTGGRSSSPSLVIPRTDDSGSPAPSTSEPPAYTYSDLTRSTSLTNGHSSPAAAPAAADQPTDLEDVIIGAQRMRNGGPHDATKVRYSRRPGDGRLKFDDSFYKRATVEERITSDGETPSSVTDIYVPVPTAAEQQSDLHETITSAYETNLSINRLLRERHKGSLAAMGRWFGTKQKEQDTKTKVAELMPIVKAKPKKKPCHWLKPIHVCLCVAAAVILAATVTTLVLYQATKKLEAANRGYQFKHNTQELLIYMWKEPNHDILEADAPVFKADLGYNLRGQSPYNCSERLSYTDNVTDIGCFRWHGETTLELKRFNIDDHTLCIDVRWQTARFDPLLEDCIHLGGGYGSWFGGFVGPASWPLGSQDIDRSPYQPGDTFGNMVERLWVSTKGVAVRASHDFPLQLRVADNKLCLSSWYGFSEGNRTMEYSVCRSDNHSTVHQKVMKAYYSTPAPGGAEFGALARPVFHDDGRRGNLEKALRHGSDYIFSRPENNETYSYIPADRLGVTVSPVVPLADPVSPDYLAEDQWLKLSTLEATRLFSVDGRLATIVNTSSAAFPPYLARSLPEDAAAVRIAESGLARITRQDKYSIREIDTTMRHYTHLYLEATATAVAAAANASSTRVFTSVLSGADRRAVVASLPPVTDLAETVRAILQTSLMGYNTLSAGPIGGQNMSAELLIRATQVAVFMPVVEFSTALFDSYNNRTLTIWANWTRQNLSVMETTRSLLQSDPYTPLYKPVWWHSPDTGAAHMIADQFIYNDRFLVAPIVDMTTNSRTVYFPPGLWSTVSMYSPRNKLDQKYYKGNRAVLFTDVPLEELLVFQLVIL